MVQQWRILFNIWKYETVLLVSLRHKDLYIVKNRFIKLLKSPVPASAVKQAELALLGIKNKA